jgi:hypothetical protein
MVSESSEVQPADAAQPSSESATERWVSLFVVDEAVEIAQDLFDGATGQLHAFLNAHPEAAEEVVSLLGRRLGGSIDESAWVKANRGLTNYLGTEPTQLLNWLAYQNTSDRLDALEPRVSPGVNGFLRTVLAQFGPELDAAQMALAAASLHDWLRIEKHVYVDQLTGVYLFALKLFKLNGEVAYIEASADSILNLTRHLLAMVAGAGDPRIFSQERIQQFLDEVVGVAGMISQPAATAPEEAPEATDAAPEADPA